ncbi:MAG: PorT family protein [Myroides sp.]|nr:PorT family protein [Myroides sp.]
MKKITLTLLGLVAFSTSALAQQEVKFGPKAGVNFATLNGKDAKEADMQVGFHIGAFAEIKFNEQFAIQPEILYSTQGAQTKGSMEAMGVTVSYEGGVKYSYINVPIMAKYYIVPSFAVEAGPYVGFLMKAEGESNIAGMGALQDVNVDLKDASNTVDFGVGVGASFNLDNGFFVGARYNLGLTKISKDYSAETEFDNVSIYSSSQTDAKNAVIQVSVGYKF